MDGCDLAKQLQTIPALKKKPVIFYTAIPSIKEAKALAKSCDVRFVLTTQSKPQLILKTVQKALREREVLSIIKATRHLERIPSEIPRLKPLKISQINKNLSKHFAEIDSIKNSLKNFITNSQEIAEKNDLSVDKVNALSSHLKQLNTLTNQLVNMSKVNMDLFSARDPNKFLRSFCKGVRKVLRSNYVVLGIVSEKGELEHFIVSERRPLALLTGDTPIPLEQGLIGKILKQRSPLKINRPSPISKDELFPNHPLIRNFLGFPLFSKQRVYGFIYFADKIARAIFSEEDQLIAAVEQLIGMEATRPAVPVA